MVRWGFGKLTTVELEVVNLPCRWKVVLMCSYHRPHSCTHAKECSACKTLHDQVYLPVQNQLTRAPRITPLFLFPIILAYGPEGKGGQMENPRFVLKGGPAREPTSRDKGKEFLQLIPLVHQYLFLAVSAFLTAPLNFHS